MNAGLEPDTAEAVQEALLLVGALALTYYCARVLLATVLLVACRVRPGLRSAALSCAPATLRPLLRRAMVLGVLGAAAAAPSAWAAAPACDPALPSLDRADACASQDATIARDPQPPPVTEPGGSHVVRAGDSLWRITESLLDQADPASIAEAWPLLWQANREAVGSDPGLLHPGTVLIIPNGLVAE